MSKERTYQEHEVRQILDLAIGQEDAPALSLSSGEGLTLRQLQEVGRDVGLSPSHITQAVAAFEGRGESVARATKFGLPTSVGRVVALPRSPSDREWELLIAELRSTFGAKGEVTSHGSLREWSNGMLHAFVEPTTTGYRLRLTDTPDRALGGIVLGGLSLVFGLFVLALLLGKGDPGFRLLIPLFFTTGGGGIAALSALALPRWAREQEKRMEHICTYAASLLAAPEPRDE